MSKINKVLGYLIILCICFITVKVLYEKHKESQKLQQPKYELILSLDDVKAYYPDADSLSLEDVSLYYIFENHEVIGKVLNTSPYSDDIYGYNGTVPLTIFFDEKDKIFEIEACENRETRSYMNKVINSGYLDRWDGLTAEESLNHHVDAISGCTFTSKAISQSVQIRMQEFSKQKSNLNSWDMKLLVRQICILVTTILALICFFNPRRTKRLRLLVLLLSVFVLGLWTNSLLSLALFYNWLTNGISLSIQIPILIVALLSILLPLISKKSFYCQYLCPFGALQEFVGEVKAKKVIISAKVFKIIFVLRRLILLSLLILVAIGTGLDLSSIEPFPIFNYQSIGFGTAVFAAVIIIASIFFNKPWCNYLCPTGTLLEIFRRRG